MTEPVIIKPTVGRRIWYWPSDHDKALFGIIDPSQPCDAGVVYVYNDRLVNLTVADHCGQIHSRTSVRLIQPDDKVPTGHPRIGYCEWMNYQLGQAGFK